MVPLVRLGTVMGLELPVAVRLPGLEMTLYEVMGLPPSEAGAVKLTVTSPLPAVAATWSVFRAFCPVLRGSTGRKELLYPSCWSPRR